MRDSPLDRLAPTPDLSGDPAGPTGDGAVSWLEDRLARHGVELPAGSVALLALVVVGLIAGAWWWSSRPAPIDVADRLPMAAVAPAPAEVINLHVHAAGAVARPGLYRMADGARVADLIDAAGGPTAEADLDRINLAARLSDGQQIYIPVVGELSGPPAASGGVDATGGTALVSLSMATAAELESLPGVGPATAAAIIAHRTEHGPFTSVEQLLDVRGIGPAKLDALRDLVTP